MQAKDTLSQGFNGEKPVASELNFADELQSTDPSHIAYPRADDAAVDDVLMCWCYPNEQITRESVPLASGSYQRELALVKSIYPNTTNPLTNSYSWDYNSVNASPDLAAREALEQRRVGLGPDCRCSVDAPRLHWDQGSVVKQGVGSDG